MPPSSILFVSSSRYMAIETLERIPKPSKTYSKSNIVEILKKHVFQQNYDIGQVFDDFSADKP